MITSATMRATNGNFSDANLKQLHSVNTKRVISLSHVVDLTSSLK